MGAEGDSTTVGAGDAVAANADQELVTVNIRCSNGSKFSVQTALDSIVGSFKALLAQNCDVPAPQQRLIYKGRILKDDQTLQSYGLQADHTVHMVRGFTPSANTNAPESNTTNPGTANTTSNPTHTTPLSGVGSLGGAGLGAGPAGLGASLFPGLGLGGNGGSSLFGDAFPEFEQVQQQLTQDPNMVREMMNNPAVQGLMNNPDLLRSLVMSSPQMREIVDRNPEVAHIFNDPSILRQTLETARNPELMREMMRNTDRAMSNIESSPEGFNMLRRMYENVQEPLLNATTMSGDAGTNNSNPFAALLGNHGGGQQRDGSNNLPTTGTNANAATVPNTNPLPNPWGPSGGSQLNTSPRPNPSGEVRLIPPPPPLGSSGPLSFEQMVGAGAPDLANLAQLLQNPAVSQMMQSLFSDPQYMNQIMNSNPQLRAMSESNPQFRELMQNPDLLRLISSPQNLRQMITLQEALSSMLPQSYRNPTETSGAEANPNTLHLDMLMNMLGGLGTSAAIENPNVPPEDLYATELLQLQEMGFFDVEANIRALQATRGNVHAAVERLLGSL